MWIVINLKTKVRLTLSEDGARRNIELVKRKISEYEVIAETERFFLFRSIRHPHLDSEMFLYIHRDLLE